MWKKMIFAIVAVLILSGVSVSQATEKAGQPDDAVEQEVIESASEWLTTVDNGKYGPSWEQASEYFKLMVIKTQWTAQISSARKAFGKMETRKLVERKYARDLPGAPDGEYYVFTYSTSFAEKAAAFETLTLRKEKDGKWRVAGYYIH